MLRKPLGLLGIFLIVVGIGYFVGAGVAYSKVQGGYGSLQAFSEAQNVELTYNEDGQLIDRGTVEGAQGIMSLLEDDWNFPVVEGDLDSNDPLVNTATEYMFQMATIGYHVLHGTQTIVLDEAYIEFQAVDDPDATVDLLAEFPNLVVLRTFSKVYGLAGLRVGFALGSARFRAAVDAVRQPFSVNALAQAAAAEAVLHQDDVEQRVERNLVERIRVEEGLRELGLRTAETQTNFSWIDLGERDEGELVAALGIGPPGLTLSTVGTEVDVTGAIRWLSP